MTQISIGRWVIAVHVAILVACGGGGGGGGGGGAADLPGTIQLLDTSFDAAEGTVVNILVARSGGSSGSVSVDYATADGTAVASSDYAAASGTLTWTDGVSGNQTISISMTDDDSAEFAESFTVTLSNVSVASLGANSSATVNIIDDDVVAQLPITPGNAPDITADVLEGISSVFGLIDITNLVDLPFPDLPTEKSGLGTSGDSLFAKLGDGRIDHKADVVERAIIADTVDCDSGTVTSTWDDADSNLELSTGDTLEVSFENCFFSDPALTLVGDAFITDIELSGDVANGIPPWSLSAVFAFVELEGTDDNETVVIDGGFDLSFSANDAITIEGLISGTSLSAMTDGETETLGDFNISQAIDVNTQTVTADASGTLISTVLDGTVDFETLASFVIIDEDNPSAGQLFVTDGGSSVLVTVLDNISIQLEVDEDADGIAETTVVVPWDDLDID